MIGLSTPNYGLMGAEGILGTGPANPYGLGPRTSAAPTDGGASMQGHTDSAASGTGYRPTAGRADRLSANIVGGSDFDNMASGGYSGGATNRI